MNDNICVMCGAELPTECGKQYCGECEERVNNARLLLFVKLINEVVNRKKHLFDELSMEIVNYESIKTSACVEVFRYARIGTVVFDKPIMLIIDLNKWSEDTFKEVIESVIDETYDKFKKE